MKISIIIPVYNEANSIGPLITYLKINGGVFLHEIIVSDGNSTDETASIAIEKGAIVAFSPQKGRSAQMNYAASLATGDIFYFIHADTLPPEIFASDIVKAVHEKYDLGRYRTKFDSPNLMLKLNAWFTRFDWFMCMGGDQTLFVTRKLFEQSGGFKNEMLIMEEYEFCERARKTGRYKIFSKSALVSARKYINRSWFKVQKANYTAVKMYKKGANQKSILSKYKEMLELVTTNKQK